MIDREKSRTNYIYLFSPANAGLMSTCVTLNPEYINPLKARYNMSSATMTVASHPTKEIHPTSTHGMKKAGRKKKKNII